MTHAEKIKLEAMLNHDLHAKIAFDDYRLDQRLNDFYDSFKSPLFEAATQETNADMKHRLLDRPYDTRHLSEHHLIADIITMAKQADVPDDRSHTDGEDSDYSELSADHDRFI